MATLDQLSAALRNADAAGDADAARVLAAEITKMRGGAAAQKAPPSVAADVVQSAPDAVVSGLTNFAGAPGSAINAMTSAGNSALGLDKKPDIKGPVEMTGFAKSFNDFFGGSNTYTPGPSRYPDAGDFKKTAEGVTGELYKPQTPGGKIGHSVIEAVSNPASYLAPGTLPAKIIGAAAGGAGSELAGQATEGTRFEPYARVAGAMGGAFVPGAGARAVTPAPSSPARQRLVDILNQEGVTSTTAGQRTGNETLRYAESTLGNAPFSGQGANRVAREGEEQLTEAVMRRAGSGPDALPETLAVNQQRLGDQFTDLSARNTLQMDPQFSRDVARAIRHYERVPPSQQKAVIEGYVNDIIDHASRGGTMPGTDYQAMRSMLSTQSKGVRQTDHYLSNALRDLRNALDDAMGRSISPADRQAWQTTRREYGAQKVIEKTMGSAAEAAGEGRIPPQAFRTTVKVENPGAYARGEGDFSELARAAATIMKPLPNSGTAQRSALYKIGDLVSGSLLPGAAGRALMSAPVQGYLNNQGLTALMPHVAPRPRSAAIAALMAAQQPQPGGP